MSRITRRYVAALSLTALIAVGTLVAGGSDSARAHHLCGNTGSPFGPFDLQTYEATDYRNSYARTMDLAGFNQIFPEHASFALPPIEGVNPSPYMPPVLLKAIAWIESGWSQASYDPLVQYGEVGPVLSSHDCGYGIMQITSGMQNVSGVANLDQAMIGGHYAFNIARGARILADKWNLAPEFRPVVGSRNTHVIEDWYYAVWGYNGFASKNHPLSHDPNRPPYLCDGTQPRSNYPYQELVFGCVAHPPVRGGAPLWPALEVHLPNLADPAFAGLANGDAFNACAYNLQCSGMNIPTPNPWHVDPTTPAFNRSQVIGDPAVSLSTASISLSAVPGGESLSTDVTVANHATGVLAWRLTASASWLRVSRSQGVSLGGDLGAVSQTLKVYGNASGLPPGTHAGTISVESLYPSGVLATISVTLLVDLQAGKIETGDFTGDGKDDLVFLCCSDYASLWVANGAGAFDVRIFRPWPGYTIRAGSWLAGDLNGDGATDLIHLCCPDYAHVWLSHGNGAFIVSAFRPWQGYDVRSGSWGAGEFSGDGKVDLVHLAPGGYVHQWTSNGAGGFDVGTFAPWPGYGIAAGGWQGGDFNGDGRSDLVHLTPSDYVHVWLANGDGGFSVTAFRPWAGYGVSAGGWQAGDLNADGKTDLVHLTPSDYVHVWLSNGDGSFDVRFFRPWSGYGIANGRWRAGDFNGDGQSDLVHLTPADYVHVWLSNGDGGFSVGLFRPWQGYRVPLGDWHAADYNGDGRTDLLHLCCYYVHVWHSQSNGGFTLSTFNP